MYTALEAGFTLRVAWLIKEPVSTDIRWESRHCHLENKWQPKVFQTLFSQMGKLRHDAVHYLTKAT